MTKLRNLLHDRTIQFDELCLKTDLQLIQLANTQLDIGIREAHQALESAENWVSAQHHCLSAERAYAQAAGLIHLARDIRMDELRRVASGLNHLREVLEGTIGSPGDSNPERRQDSHPCSPIVEGQRLP